MILWDFWLTGSVPSKIEWDHPNGPRSVSCDRAIRYSGWGVRSVGSVGDFLDLYKKRKESNWYIKNTVLKLNIYFYSFVNVQEFDLSHPNTQEITPTQWHSDVQEITQPNRKSPQQVDFPMAQAHRPKSWTNRNHLLKRLCLWGVLQTVAKLKRHPIGTGSPNLMTRYCLRPLKNRSALVFDGKSKWIPKISVLPVLTKSYWQYQSQWQIWETMRSCWHRM